MSAPRLHQLVIYGASGFSGQLIVAEAVRRGLRPLLAGRNQDRIEPIARSFGLPCAVASVTDSVVLRSLASSATVLLNTAGPFVDTAPALIDACIESGTHYLDITGEVRVVELAAARSMEAAARGVLLMPAVGFDVVPSDCLAMHVARRLPDAQVLRIGLQASTTLSRGSLETALTQSARGIMIREAGRLVATPPASRAHQFDFGKGPRQCLGVSLADVSTAFHSTGIANIETYMRASAPLWGTLLAMRVAGGALASPAWRGFVRSQAKSLREGPTESERQAGWSVIVAEAVDTQGRRVISRLRSGEPYAVTAVCAVNAIERVLSGDIPAGFRTPAQLLGADFVLGIAGTTREDL